MRFAGEMHYFRLPRASWLPCLRGLKALGFTAVDLLVPWCLHEPARGQVDFAAHLDLRHVMELAAGEGMEVILRPGPHLGRELPGIGFPEWLLAEDSLLARTAGDTPALWPFPPKMVPLPSYASRVFQGRVASWFGRVAEVVGPFADSVLAVVADHELGLFHRRGVFDLDYHPDALGWFGEEFPKREAPREPGGDPTDAWRWIRFQERYRRRAAAWLGKALEGVGFADWQISSPIGPDLAPLPGSAPSSYGRPDNHGRVRAEVALAAALSPKAIASISAGGSPFLLPRSPGDDLSQLAATISAGVDTLSVASAVERDRWYGSWIDASGRATKHGEKMGRVVRALAPIEAAETQPALAVVRTRAEGEIARASSALIGLPPLIGQTFGASPHLLATDSEARDKDDWYRVLGDALRLAQIPYRECDESLEDATGFRAVIIPTLDRVDEGLWARAHEWGEAGIPVVIGPRRPSRNAWDEPLSQADLPKRCGLLKEGSLTDTGALADDLLSLAGELSDDLIAPEQQNIECTVLRDKGDGPRIVIVANCSKDDRTAEVTVADSRQFVDPYCGDVLKAKSGGIGTVSLKRRQVRLFVSER